MDNPRTQSHQQGLSRRRPYAVTVNSCTAVAPPSPLDRLEQQQLPAGATRLNGDTKQYPGCFVSLFRPLLRLQAAAAAPTCLGGCYSSTGRSVDGDCIRVPPAKALLTRKELCRHLPFLHQHAAPPSPLLPPPRALAAACRPQSDPPPTHTHIHCCLPI